MGSSQTPQADRPAPALGDRYRVRRHLASGGMASVWCADDLVLGRPVAVKVLAERFAHDEIAVRRFKREARAAARVSTHPHVVTIYDVGDLAPEERGAGVGRAFIVMQYLAGGTVGDAIRVGAVRRQEAVRWLREAASALDHAHARGIVHRDIKPANFLLNRSRVLHVADFGIARLVSEDTITTAGELFGTAAYLSPEQALGREATGASDRYALAIAAFELLAGERPFAAEHFAAQARQHIEQPPPHASDRDRTLPQAIDAVLIRGMAKQPEDRFETAGEFVDALATALSRGIMADIQNRRRNGAGHAGGPVRAAGAGSPAGVARAAGAGSPAGAARAAGAARTAGNGAWSPADTLQRASPTSRRGGRTIALSALLVGVLAIVAVALAGLSGSRRPVATASRGQRHTAPSSGHRSHPRQLQASIRRPSRKTGTTASQHAGSATSATTTPPPPPSADELQRTGYAEMQAGNYQEAITTLRQAVAAADHDSLTYAYGLYNLGKSLLLAGDAAQAVPILEQRYQIPNQPQVVLATLNEARQQAGLPPIEPIQPVQPSPTGKTPPGHAKHKHGPPGSGGAALAPGHGHNQGDEHTNLAD